MEEIAEGRKLKKHLSKTWYRFTRGGKEITPTKDLPWTSQRKEIEGRQTY